MADGDRTTTGVRGSFTVGDWLVEPELGRLSHPGRTVQLELKVMALLVRLAASPGELVTRRDLLDTVWDGEFIADNTITHAVAELRRALGDDARHPMYVETIHRRGYRLLAEVGGALPSPPSSTYSLSTPAGEEVEVAPGENLIGRAPEAAVTIDSAKVSRRHARIVVDGEGATLEDLGSKNGTFLNGARLDAPARLAAGDEIRIGRNVARLRFAVAGERTMTEVSADRRSP